MVWLYGGFVLFIIVLLALDLGVFHRKAHVVRMREALKAAIQEARSKGGYSTEDIKMATLALVGFLDESVLNTRSPMFVGWSRKPLQEELFGIHMAGECEPGERP